MVDAALFRFLICRFVVGTASLTAPTRLLRLLPVGLVDCVYSWCVVLLALEDLMSNEAGWRSKKCSNHAAQVAKASPGANAGRRVRGKLHVCCLLWVASIAFLYKSLESLSRLSFSTGHVQLRFAETIACVLMDACVIISAHAQNILDIARASIVRLKATSSHISLLSCCFDVETFVE